MKKFKDFGIKPEITSFTGDKIKMDRIVNREILVTNFKVGPSSQKENSKCLTLEFKMNGHNHIAFTGSTVLMQMITDLPKDALPFSTTIIRDNEYFEFT